MLKPLHKNVKKMLNHMLKLTYGLTLFRLIFITWGCAQCCLTTVIEGTGAFNIAYGRWQSGYFEDKPQKFSSELFFDSFGCC
jgi:hypothetical protein